MDEIYIDPFGFVWIGNFRLPLRLVGDEIEFVDRNRYRCNSRGSKYIRVETDIFVEKIKVLQEDKIVL